MPRGGRRVGAGRKPKLTQLARWSVGAQVHNLLVERARQEANERLENRVLVRRANEARRAVEAKYNWPNVREQMIATRRSQLASLGMSDAELDELRANTVVAPPPGMAADMAAAVQKVFGARKRNYSEPIRRAYAARAKAFENNALETVADKENLSLRMVESCLREYRALLADLRRDGHLLNSA